MPPVERDGISGEQSPHHLSQRDLSTSKEKTRMIWEQRPCITQCLRLRQQGRETAQEILTIVITPEYLSPFDPSDHQVMQNK
jgi:hypothetical protein